MWIVSFRTWEQNVPRSRAEGSLEAALRLVRYLLSDAATFQQDRVRLTDPQGGLVDLKANP